MSTRRVPNSAQEPPPASTVIDDDDDNRRLLAERTICGLRPAVVLCVSVASCFSFLLGYDIGIMSGAKRLIARDMHLSTVQVELLVGSLN
eukprot:6621975-Prymnesium_polylepis.1